MSSPYCDYNVTAEDFTPLNTTGNKAVYEQVYSVLYGYGLPAICACGFLGNVMNLVIMGGKRTQRSLRKVERSANIGLMSLAVADMMFCLTAFPSTFLPQDMEFETKGFLLYYGCYCAAVINIFIMTSTWLTVTMATERYLAICHPLKSRNIISLQRTKVVIVLVYLFSAIINVPVFWRYHIQAKTCAGAGGQNVTTYMMLPQVLYDDENFDHVYRAIWAVIGNFVPLLLLLVFNIGLMKQIHKSYAMRKQMNGNAGIHHNSSHDNEASQRITVTLVAIVVMFFILVAPSEILKHVAYLIGGNLSTNFTYLTIEIITNVMQTINFSANFILYCIINPSFRRSMREMFCFSYHKLSMDNFDSIGGDAFNERYASVRMSSFKTQSMRSPPTLSSKSSRTLSVRSIR